METVTIKGFIMRTPYGQQLSFCGADMSDHGYIMVGPYEFEYTIPESYNPVAAEVSCLEKKLENLKEEHTRSVIAIERRIANLLCIENGAEVKIPDFDISAYAGDGIPF